MPIRKMSAAFVLLLAACVHAPAPTLPPDADVNARICSVLNAADAQAAGAEGPQLSEQQSAALTAIEATDLPTPSIACGSRTYKTGFDMYSTTYVSVGFSADGALAGLHLQASVGPLAGAGYGCLLARDGDSWRQVGCRMDWIN